MPVETFDLVTPGIGFGSEGTIGLMEATALGFLGKRVIDARATNELEYAAIPHLLSKQAAASRPVPPTLYVRGKADHLVGAGHPAALAAAMATHYPSVDYQYHEIDAMHDTMVSQADYEHLLRWCRANIA